MMKRLLILIIALVFFITSCKKENRTVDQQSNAGNYSTMVEKINEFKPDRNMIAMVYHKIVKQQKAYEEGERDEAKDQAIDTALWNMETYINTKYGFNQEYACYKYSETKDTATFTIIKFEKGVPIVDGEELQSYLNQSKTTFENENNDSNDIFFWCNLLNVTSINNDKVTVERTIVRTVSYYGVYPPGWDPDEFEHYTCMYAFKHGECDGTYWRGAHNEYEYRYEIHDGRQIQSEGYAMIYDYSFYKAPLHYGINGRLFYVPWITSYTILNTNPPDELNSYLLSTKSVVDDYNPNGLANRYLGNIDVWRLEIDVPPVTYTGHAITFFIFELTFVGLPD